MSTTNLAIHGDEGRISHAEFMETPGRGVARNTALIQNWLNQTKAILFWDECNDDGMIRFAFDPREEVPVAPPGVWFDADAISPEIPL